MNKSRLLLLGVLVGACEAFLVPAPLLHSRFMSQSHTPRIAPLKSSHSGSFPQWDEENDPYRILGIDGTSADPQFILNTFRRLTHKYHPDVVTSKHSTPEERQAAQDHFEKICRAFEAIYSGKVPPRPVTRATDTPVRRPDAPKQTPPTTPSGFPTPSQDSTAAAWPLGSPDTTNEKRPKRNVHFYSSNGDVESLGKFFDEIFGGGPQEMEGGFGSAGGTGDPGLDMFQNIFQQLLGGAFAPPHPSQRRAGPVRKPIPDETVVQKPTNQAGQSNSETQAIAHSVEALRSRLKTIRHNMDQWNSDLQRASNFGEKLQIEALQAEADARTKILTHYIQQGEQRLLELQNKQNNYYQQSQNPNQSTPGGVATPPMSQSPLASNNSPSNPGVHREEQYDSYDSNLSGRPQSKQTPPEVPNNSDESSDDDWIQQGFGRRNRRGTAVTSPNEENHPAVSKPSEQQSSQQASEDVSEDSEDDDDDWIHQGFGRRNQRGASRRRPQGRSIPISDGRSRSENSPSNQGAPHRQTHDDFKQQRQREEKARQDQVEDELRKLKELLGF